MLAKKIAVRDTDHEQELRSRISEKLLVTSEAPTTAHLCGACDAIIAFTDEDWVPQDALGPCPFCGTTNAI